MIETIRRPAFEDDDVELPVDRLNVEPAGRRTGCPFHDVRQMLREVGLRPTRQRLALGWLMFAKGDRHMTAETLHEEALRARFPVSLATVYNTLHQFTDVGPPAAGGGGRLENLFRHQLVRPPSFLCGRRQPPSRHPRRRASRRQTADAAARLRYRAHRRGGAPTAQELVGRCNRRCSAGLSPAFSFRGVRVLLNRLVGVDTPQTLLFDVALEPLAEDAAPFAAAVFHGTQHAALQSGSER